MDPNTSTPTVQPPAPGTELVSPSFSAPQRKSAGSGLRFLAFGVIVIGASIVGGLYQTGNLALPWLNLHTTASGNHFTSVAPSAPSAPVPPLKTESYVVTSISIGQPSIAIINGKSRAEGDPLDETEAKGWIIKRITEDAVLVQNGSATATLPLSSPDLKPLDDTLHPLN